jgi:predicted nuclease of predicted toxin-antitoxin system
MKILVDMNLSPGWASFLTEMGFEAIHWSGIPTVDEIDVPRRCDRAAADVMAPS